MNGNMRAALTEKIIKQYKLNVADAVLRAEMVMKKCPQILMKNVCEWVRNMPLTDVYVGEYSLPMILSIWNNSDFLRALEVMEELLEGHTEMAELKIWEMRR